MDYKEKIKEAKRLYETANADQRYMLESLFPELKEPESERIRKILVEAVTQVLQDQYCSNRGVSKEKVVAWLEKMGEQKPVLFETPKTPVKDATEVSSRMQYIDDDLKPIADFIIDYADWDLRREKWNHPTPSVPLFRVLDALIQRGKPYTEG